MPTLKTDQIHPLAAWRKRQKLSQQKAAKLVGVAQKTWCSWENGVFPRYEYLTIVVNFTGGEVTANELFDHAQLAERRASLSRAA